MKALHIVSLVVGAALAGGLAVRMAAPPPLPHVAQPPSIARSRTPVPAPAAPLPAVRRLIAVPGPSVVAAAPAPIYSEPPYVEQPVRRRPFVDVPRKEAKVVARAVDKTPVVRVADPPVAPIPYRELEQRQPEQRQPERVAEAPAAEPPHVTPPPRQVVLPAGTQVTVRLLQKLSTDHTSTGDSFEATLADPLVSGGLIVAERGARVKGRITDAHKAGRWNGASSLELRLSEFTTADGQRIAISCDPWLKRGDTTGRGSAEKIGGGAALGAIIGAIAGGGLGAAIGAGAGGGVGAGAAAVTGGKPVTIPSETVVRFRLASQVTITERPLY